MAEKSIDQLLAELGGMNYKPPTSLNGYQSSYKPVDRNLPDWTPSTFTQGDFQSTAKKKKDRDGINLWDVLSGTLGQPSGIMTDFAHNSIGAWGQVGNKKNKTGLGKELFDALIGSSLPATVGKGLFAGGKKQVQNWTDGKLSWGDVPGVGVLNGMDKHWKRGTDIVDDYVGIKNKTGRMAAGIGLDIALDPLTYLTGGLSAATKARKVAEAAEIVNQAKKLGVAGKFKNAAQFQAAAETALKAKYAKYPNLAESMARKKVGTMRDEIAEASRKASEGLTGRVVDKKIANMMDEIKTSANSAYNQNINKWGFGVPFSNKANVMVGNYGKGNLLHRSEAVVGANLVDNLLGQASMGDDALKSTLQQVVKVRYGVDDIADLTKTQFDDLHKNLSPVIEKLSQAGNNPTVEMTSKLVEKAMPEVDFTRLMSTFVDQNVPWKDVQGQLHQILKQMPDAKTRSSMGSHLAEMVAKYWDSKPSVQAKHVTSKKAESMAWASRFLTDSDSYKTVENTVTGIDKAHSTGKVGSMFSNTIDKTNKVDSMFSSPSSKGVVDELLDTPYNAMSNGRTKFEHWLDTKNPFDTRTLNTGDKFVNSMGDEISNAQSMRVGETAQYGKGLEDIQKFVKDKKITKEQMEQAIYVIEKHAPDALGKNWTPSRTVNQLADKLRPVIDDIGKNETAGDVLKNLRSNYFPHVINKSSDIIDDVDDFIKRNKEFNNLKGTNKFDQSRKGFQTLAQRDNYIARIEKAIQKETNPDRIEILRKQIDHVADIFDTDVVSALTRRVREGTRAKAMKAMQGELSKFGMMQTIKKGSQDAPITGLTKLEPDIAKKLGLGEGKHYIHPEVLKALERVDEIFTNQNMNKAGRMVSSIGDIWRPLVTYYKPAHYINNMIGNTMMNIAAGVKLSDVTKASKLMKVYRSGKATESELKIIKAAYSENVISGGFLFDSRATWEFDVPSGIEKFAKFIGENKAITKVRKKGEVIDDVSRLANYINGLNKFGDSKKAAEQVRKYLFNYNELTNADRNMRVLVPFWNWTKRNIPLQLKLLMENPQFPLNVERFKNFFNEGQKGENWQKESGIKISDDYYTGLPSPTHDLGMLLNPKQLLSSSTPAIKMPLEMSFNRKIYTGKPISYGSDNVQSEDMLDYLMSNLGVGNNAYQAATGDKSTFENIMGMLKPVSKIRE